jgi:hypothetical protein
MARSCIRWRDGGGQRACVGPSATESAGFDGTREAARRSHGDVRSRRRDCRSVGTRLAHRGIVERVTGIEPAFSAWEADVLPLNYTRQCFREGSNAFHASSTCFSGTERVH